MSGTGRARLALHAALLIAPLLALSVSRWDFNAPLVFLGMLPSLNALLVSTRYALFASAVTPGCMVGFLLLRGDVLAGTAAMALLGAAIGLSASRPWHVAGSFVGPQASLALIGAPVVVLSTGAVPADASSEAVLSTAAWVASGGLWATVVARRPVAELGLSGPADVSAPAARVCAAALALLAGAITFVAMQWLDTPYAWWMLLTVFVIIQPDYGTSLAKLASRVAGTVAGAALAALAAVSIESQLVITIVALALTAAALWAYMERPYWVYALLLTPAVVLQTSGGAGAIVDADLDRVGFTLAAAGASAAVLIVGRWVLRRLNVPGLVRPST